MKKRPEILAPCGNMASLKAAIAAGADACYLAGNSFGARAYADNFSPDELIEAIKQQRVINLSPKYKEGEYKNLNDLFVFLTTLKPHTTWEGLRDNNYVKWLQMMWKGYSNKFFMI